ncbi:MAG: InlB B-repeat-containing protein [Coriobacteriales bacterium]
MRYLTPQSTNTVTIHFDVGFSTLPTSSTITSAGYTTVEQLVADANKKFGVKAIGNSFDPIFDANGKLMFRAGDSYTFTFDTTSTATKNASLAELNAIFKGMKRYGYSPTQHTFIRMLNGKLMATNVNWSETNYFASTLASAMSATVTNAHIYTKWGDSKFDVQYYDTDGIKVAGIGGPTGWNDELKYPTKADYPTAVFEDPYKIYMTSRMYPNSLDPDCATPLTAGLTLSQFVNQLTGYGTSTHDYDLNFINPGQHYELVCKTQEVKVSFDVTYQPNGATGTAQKVTYDNLAATAGAKPTGWTDKVGHTFLGWAKTSGATTADYAVGAALTNIGGNGTPADGGNYTLYAVWKPNEYTVTYNYNKPSGVTANPGSWPANGKVNHGSNYTISSNTPTLTGYRFDGWATTAAGAVAYAKGATINNVTANVNLYAKWTAMYTVSYNGNGSTSGSAPASSTVAAGSSYTVAANTFTKTGAVFQGWNTAANGSGTAYAPGASFTVNANTTLYAQWATNPAISFNANTPSGAVTSVTGLPGSTTVTYNTPYTLPTTTPSVMGYTFAGWKIANAGTTYAAGGKTGNITTATVFYAQWTERTGFSAVFYDKSSGASDGTAYNTQSNKNWTAQITLPTAPTKTGYTFGGWFLQKDSNGSGTGTQFSAAKGFNQLWLDAQKAGQANESTTTIKLYAKWTEKDRVTFTLNPNGGQYKGTTGVDTTSNILNGGSFTIPTNVTNPTRVGYNFAGWTENAAGTGTVYQAGAVFNNLTTSKTLYAKWNAASVTFTFEKGATDVTALKTPDPYTMSANYGSNLAVPAGSTVYARTGFTHGGWSYTNASNANATVAAAGASVAVANFKIVWSGDSAAGTLKGTAVLTAIWNPYTYTIQWNANGGSPNTTTANVQPTTTVNVPASNPSRSGYTFKGWNTAADGSGKVVTSGSAVNAIFNLSGVASGATLPLYAQWEENKVQIRFYSDNYSTLQFAGTGYTDGTILYVGAATGAIYASATATTPISGRNISGGVTPVIDSNHEYSATSGSKWAVGAYSGTAVAAANIGAGGKLTVPKTGGLYTTADYYLTVSPKGIGFTVEYYFQDVNSDTTYTINASATTSDTAPFGYVVTAGTTAGTAGTTITIVRKSFTGFTYDDAKTGTAKSITIGGTPAGNVIKLYFKRNVNTVHVEYSGDVPAGAVYTPASQDVKYGATVNLTVPATVTGYTFTGWKVVSGGVTISSNSFTMPNNAVSIEGVWAKNKFNVTFKNSNTSQGTLSGTTSYSLSFDEHLAAVPTATAKVGYYFLGWEVHENCTTSGNESTGTNMGIVSTDALLGLDGTVATPWTCNGNAVMIARWGKTLSIVYTSPSTGGFTEVNGAVTSGVVTQPGTRYVNLQAGINLPQYGGAFDPAGDRNANNPKAKPGYKFTGWKFTADDGSTGTVQGYYNAGVFVRTGGANMPTVVNMSYEFEAVYVETTQQLHFDNNVANMSGLTGTGATDVTAKTGESVTLPQNATYKMTTNPSAYELLGWTLDATYKEGTSTLYTTSFTMTPGTKNPTLYNMAGVDFGYGVTLYPVFREKLVTITYTTATGSASMGTLSKNNEGTSFGMVSGTPAGSKPTAGTGHKFLGWFTDAAGTNPVPAPWVSADNTLKPQKTGGVYATATYYAKFEAEQYDITFKVGDHGTWSDGTTADKGAKITYNNAVGSARPGTTPATGYVFKQWVDQNGKTYSNATLEALKITGPGMVFTATWEERTGYTIIYNENGGTPHPANQSVSWTAVINTIMSNDAKNVSKQGYDFDGWYAKADFSAGSKLTNTMTYAEALAAAGKTVNADGTAELTLFAKWNEKSYTIHYNARYPEGTSPAIADKTVTWTQANLLASGFETLTVPGYDFIKWSSTTANTGMTVNNSTVFSALYQSLFGTTDNTKTEITLYGIWDQKSFTVRFVDDKGADLRTPISGLTWNDQIDYFDYAVSDGSAFLNGWKYTPAGGTQQTWLKSDGKLNVSAFDGTPTPADGATFILTADLIKNAIFEIQFNTVDFMTNTPGTLDPNGIKQVGSVTGYMTPGQIADITNLNTHDYIAEFERPDGTNRNALLKGYVYQVVNWPAGAGRPDTKTTSIAADVVSGAKVTFVVYWVEKQFTVKYDLGSDAFGNPAPSTVVKPADKNVGWNSTNLTPTGSDVPVWEGYYPPKWQYKNASGSWVDVPAGAKFSAIALNDDTLTSVTLRAKWEADQVRITYTTQTGGTAKSADNVINVPNHGSAYEDINAVSGTPHAVTATANAGYKFIGWYKDGVLVTSGATLTVVKTGDTFTSGTYEARFTPLGQIDYTIEYWLEQLDGTYAQDPTLAPNGNGSGEENSTVVVTDAMKKNIKGFTYTPGVTGSIETIDPLVPGKVLKLYYVRNAYNVTVTPAAPGADAPETLPVPVYPSTGITSSSTEQKYGTPLVIPTMPANDGWTFSWTVSYTEKGSTTAVTKTYANGANFTMPDGPVTIVGVWSRNGHNVAFRSDSTPGMGGTVTVKPGSSMPFTVSHGKNLLDASSTGSSKNITVTADYDFVFAGWSYVGADGVTYTTQDPDSVIINCDTTFTAIWAQTFFVSYGPGNGPNNHGGTGFTSTIVADDEVSGNPNVNTIPLMIGGVDRTQNAPAAAGYRFVGWTWSINGTNYYWIAPSGAGYDTSSLRGTAGTLDFEVRSNVEFVAIWEALEQDLIFSLGMPGETGTWTPSGIPGTAGTTGDYAVAPKPRTDQVVTLLTAGDITRDNYTLEGWKIWTDANGDGVIQAGELSAQAYTGTFKMPAHSVVFVPVWSFDGLKINYAIGTPSGSTTVRGTLSSFGEPITDPNKAVAAGSTATAKPGYKFVGWYLDAECTIPLPTDLVNAWVTNSLDGTIIRSSKIAPHRPDGGWLPVTYYALFAPAATEYTITYMVQDISGTGYNKLTSSKFTDIESEGTADVTDPSNPAYAHLLDTTTGRYYGLKFVTGITGELLRAFVKANGTTELIVYYNRIPYDITYDLGTNGTATGTWTGNAGPSQAFGTVTVNVPGATLAGMSLAGWEAVWTDPTDGTEKKVAMPNSGAHFTMPYANVQVRAIWAKNVEFTILVYKLSYDENGKLVVTTEAIPTNWPNKFTTVEGTTVTIKPNGSTLTITGSGTQTSSLPGTLPMPSCPGWAYVAGSCDPFGVYSTAGLGANGEPIVLKIFYAPKTGYVINYVVELDGKTINVGKRDKNVYWTTNDLAFTGSVSGITGYEIEGYGWQYKDAAGNLHDITAAMTYGNVVRGIHGVERDTIMSITLYAKLKARNYKVIWADDTNGADSNYVEILTKNNFGWTSNVPLSDPATLNKYNKPGYKWMGWEVRPAGGATPTKYAPGATIDLKTLAALLGISDRDDSSSKNAIVLYAVWVKWAPVTIEFYTNDGGTQVKLPDTVHFSEADQVVYEGARYTVSEAIVKAHRPMGYTIPGTMPSLIAKAEGNILKVIYNAISDFKLNLATNYGEEGTLAQIITGLTWNEKPDAKATAEPTRVGYRLLDKPARWNTKADGSGHSFDADATYAQIAAWIYGAGIDDMTVLEKGITLYAQWTLANDFEVIYDLNNDPEKNGNVLTVVPDNRTPIDVEEKLNMHNVGWNEGGFDKSNDAELDAAPNGYEFAGWNTKADGTGLQIDNTMTYKQVSEYLDPKHEQKKIVLYAQWKELVIEITYTVSNEEHGSIDRFVDKVSAVTLQPVDEGSSAGTKLHSVATAKPGYHFVEWVLVTPEMKAQMLAQAGNTYANVLKMLRDDKSELSIDKHANDGRLYAATYMARFERNADASVIYDANGGWGSIDPTTTAHGLTFNLDGGSNFGMNHHTLKGWNTKPDGTGTHYALGQTGLVMPEEGMKLYAEWGINSYGVHVLPPKDGGSVNVGDTDVVWGEKIPQSYIDGLNPWADYGHSFAGWDYKMTNADTGEVTMGHVDDLSQLTVLGELELTPVFEGSYVVDGPPRTGDQAMTLSLEALAGIAALMLLLLLVARRRREEEEEN